MEATAREIVMDGARQYGVAGLVGRIAARTAWNLFVMWVGLNLLGGVVAVVVGTARMMGGM
jgi:hypothetical protein